MGRKYQHAKWSPHKHGKMTLMSIFQGGGQLDHRNNILIQYLEATKN